MAGEVEALMREQLAEQQKFDEAFRKAQEEHQARLGNAHQELLNAMIRTQSTSPELTAVVEKLRRNPLLIPAVDKFIDSTLAKVQTAIQGALGLVLFFVLCGVACGQQDAFRALLPKVDSITLTKKLSDPQTFFYDDRDFPRAYQITGESGDLLPGVHSAFNDISGGADIKNFGNANREFPWGDPAGTRGVKNFYAFRFVWLPPRDDGGRWPIVYWGRLQPGGGRGVHWTFPKGAVVGECFCLYDSDGYAWPFELRVRDRNIDSWQVDVFKPFPSAADLLVEAERLGLTKLASQLRTPADMLPVKHVRADHPRPSFNSTATVETLRAIPAADVKKLLRRPFKSALGVEWKQGTHAPTTKAAFHIVPADYSGFSIAIDSESCMRCHQDTLKQVDTFGPLGRDWYGHVRGSDGIFSLHPFSRESISDSGTPLSVRFDHHDGLFAQYNPSEHPRSMYRTIKGVR